MWISVVVMVVVVVVVVVAAAAVVTQGRTPCCPHLMMTAGSLAQLSQFNLSLKCNFLSG